MAAGTSRQGCVRRGLIDKISFGHNFFKKHDDGDDEKFPPTMEEDFANGEEN
jgi:hypothetical protein